MRALILNSGLGKRMGTLTSEHPKCMTELKVGETIVGRQLKQLAEVGIRDVVMTTGPFEEILTGYIKSLNLDLDIKFVNNPIYDKTNYIYSIYMARELLKGDDIIMMHGDLVFENSVLDGILAQQSAMTVSSTIPLPEKDFKAVIKHGYVLKVGIDFFEDAMEAQALYKLNRADWNKWLAKIIEFCDNGNRKVYAENALNELNGACAIKALDVKDRLCSEIDTPEDLAIVTGRLAEIEK